MWEPFAGYRHAGKQPHFRRMRSPAGSTNGIGDNDLSPTASSMEPFAGGKSAGNSRSFGECIPRQAVPTASGAAFFLQIFLL